MSDYTTIWAAGKPVGRVQGDVFYKRVRSSRHFLRRPPSICVDVQSLRDAEAAGARWVLIEDADTGRKYRSHISTIRKRGRYLDRGHGAQYALGLSAWEVDDPKVTHEQLPLFGGAA